MQAQRANLSPDVVRRSRRVAAVLVEPIQGEGGVRMASARFMRKLRLLTRIYDVPLVFDEVQTGWGMTGRLWAHELFDLPCPPDVVTWAKKAQNGVLFVSEELATFFQEEKKFNTTWEGDSVGMVRLLALLDKLDLDQVRRTGERARSGLEALAREHREILKNVRGAGVMLGLDVMRADWCEALLDRAFRRGLMLLAAGERACVSIPATTPSRPRSTKLCRSCAWRSRISSAGAGPDAGHGTRDPRRHAGVPARHDRGRRSHACDLRAHKLQILAVEQERYGAAAQYPPDVLRAGRRPLLQFQLETLEATMASPARSGSRCATACRDDSSGTRSAARSRTTTRKVSARIRASARTTRSICRRWRRCPPRRTTSSSRTVAGVAARACDRGRIRVPLDADRGSAARHRPGVVPTAAVLERIDNYLGSGVCFAYLQAALKTGG